MSSELSTVLFACLPTGLAFAGLATWLMTRRGNTIRDLMSHGTDKATEALRLEITQKIKISSNFPVVGLYVIAAFVALGVPFYYISQITPRIEDSIRLMVRLDTPGPYDGIYLVNDDDGSTVTSGGLFKLSVNPANKTGTTVTLRSDMYLPLTLYVKVQSDRRKLTLQMPSAREPCVLDINDNVASYLDGIKLTPKPASGLVTAAVREPAGINPASNPLKLPQAQRLPLGE